MHRTHGEAGNILARLRRMVALGATLCSVTLAGGCRRESPSPAGAATASGGPAASGAGPSSATSAASDPASAREAATARAAAEAGARAEAAGTERAPPADGVPDPPPPPERRDGAQARPEPILDGYGFPLATPLAHLCGRRALLPGGEPVVWDAFTSEAEPGVVIDAFGSRLSERGLVRDGDGGAWRLPAGAAAPQRVLEVRGASAPGRHEACGSLPPGARTVVVASRL
ncbi:MAG: hypothetical protein IT376_20045 [Polyangiaceae bacterium]|nr:hypothetical protein [Polyangiaceae bacterium]